MKKLNKITYSIIVVVFVFLLSLAFSLNKLNKEIQEKMRIVVNLDESTRIDEKLTFFGLEVMHFKSENKSDGKLAVSIETSNYYDFIPIIFAFGATSIIAVISGGVWLLLSKTKRRT